MEENAAPVQMGDVNEVVVWYTHHWLKCFKSFFFFVSSSFLDYNFELIAFVETGGRNFPSFVPDNGAEYISAIVHDTTILEKKCRQLRSLTVIRYDRKGKVEVFRLDWEVKVW